MLIAISVGTIYGAISGAAGGVVDTLMMRVVDALLAFPSFFLIITVEALTEKFALVVIISIIGLLSWMGVARLVRGEVLSLRERDFVEAARAHRRESGRVVLRHLIPNALGPVVVAATLAIGDSSWSKRGSRTSGSACKCRPPSWGNMLQDALTPDARIAYWLVVTPGSADRVRVARIQLARRRTARRSGSFAESGAHRVVRRRGGSGGARSGRSLTGE